MDLDLGCVASFLLLLEEGHYGRAAVRLHLSRSALTKRIQRLEHQVGVALLVRDESGVAGPTPAGRRFADQAEYLLQVAEAAQAAARDREPPLTVRLGVPGRVGDFPDRRHLRELARRLAKAHPGVRLACRSISLTAPHAALVDGEVDVVWAATSTGPASVATVPLIELQRIGVVSADHDLAEAESVPADELADRPLLYLPCAPPELISSFVLADVRPARLARLVETEATDSQSIVQGLGPGQAAVFADGSWASSAPMSGIHHLRLTGLEPIPLYAAHRRSDRRGPVRTLVELLPQVAAS